VKNKKNPTLKVGEVWWGVQTSFPRETGSNINPYLLKRAGGGGQEKGRVKYILHLNDGNTGPLRGKTGCSRGSSLAKTKRKICGTIPVDPKGGGENREKRKRFRTGVKRVAQCFLVGHVPGKEINAVARRYEIEIIGGG